METADKSPFDLLMPLQNRNLTPFFKIPHKILENIPHKRMAMKKFLTNSIYRGVLFLRRFYDRIFDCNGCRNMGLEIHYRGMFGEIISSCLPIYRAIIFINC